MRDGEPAADARWRVRARRGAGTVATAALAVAALAGCAARAGASPWIVLGTAYVAVPQTPGTTVAYVVIRNNGPADRLMAARTSAGGRVSFRVARGPGASVMSTVGSVRVPGHATFAMVPDGVHMLITRAGPMRGGSAITLTLVFASAGPVSVVAQVTNPQSGGSSYFVN
jgi:copper(I)-binding protein